MENKILIFQVLLSWNLFLYINGSYMATSKLKTTHKIINIHSHSYNLCISIDVLYSILITYIEILYHDIL